MFAMKFLVIYDFVKCLLSVTLRFENGELIGIFGLVMLILLVVSVSR